MRHEQQCAAISLGIIIVPENGLGKSELRDRLIPIWQYLTCSAPCIGMSAMWGMPSTSDENPPHALCNSDCEELVTDTGFDSGVPLENQRSVSQSKCPSALCRVNIWGMVHCIK